MSDYNLVLALSDNAGLTDWLALAERLLPEGGANGTSEIHLRGMVTIEQGTSLSEGALQARALRETLTQVALDHPRAHDTAPVYVDYQPFQSVLDDIARLKADLLLAADDDNKLAGSPSRIFENAPCDVVLVTMVHHLAQASAAVAARWTEHHSGRARA
jgi:hypothetical protein